jgi:hypothetical protein
MTGPVSGGDETGACHRRPLPEAGRGPGGEVPRAYFRKKPDDALRHTR